MHLVIAAGLSLITLVAFFVTKKYLHLLELVIIYLSAVFLYCCYISVLDVNLGKVNVSEDIPKLLAFRMSELFIFPLLITALIDWFYADSSAITRGLGFLAGIGLMLCAELWLLSSTISYNQWNIGFTLLVWMGIIVVSWINQQGYRYLLKWDEVL